MSNTKSEIFTELISEMESIEKEKCNLPLVFTEVLKDEINANDETKLYNGIKRFIRKYSGNDSDIEIANEFVSVISGGASLREIIAVAIEEIQNPTITSAITTNDRCEDI